MRKPRNRVVVFRVNDEEFETLTKACSVKGANTLSEFTRTELLSRIDSEPKDELQDRFSSMEQRIEDLHSTVKDLVHLVKRGQQ